MDLVLDVVEAPERNRARQREAGTGQEQPAGRSLVPDGRAHDQQRGGEHEDGVKLGSRRQARREPGDGEQCRPPGAQADHRAQQRGREQEAQQQVGLRRR
jgi:hypothetical protein